MCWGSHRELLDMNLGSSFGKRAKLQSYSLQVLGPEALK